MHDPEGGRRRRRLGRILFQGCMDRGEVAAVALEDADQRVAEVGVTP